jgi:hypothetical protein
MNDECFQMDTAKRKLEKEGLGHSDSSRLVILLQNPDMTVERSCRPLPALIIKSQISWRTGNF